MSRQEADRFLPKRVVCLGNGTGHTVVAFKPLQVLCRRPLPIADAQRKTFGSPMIHVEAVIAPENFVSQRVATVIFDSTPVTITDREAGLPALHYSRRMDLPMRRH